MKFVIFYGIFESLNKLCVLPMISRRCFKLFQTNLKALFDAITKASQFDEGSVLYHTFAISLIGKMNLEVFC